MPRSLLTRSAPVAGLAAILLAGCAAMSPPAPSPGKMTEDVLTDARGITLYTFDRDVAGTGKSLCHDDCERNWPPYYVPSGGRATGEYTVVMRNDGKAQWAYKGKPLYFWPEDTEPGDKFGDEKNGLWRVIGKAGPLTVAPKVGADGY